MSCSVCSVATMEAKGKKKFVGKSGKAPRGKVPHGKKKFKKGKRQTVLNRRLFWCTGMLKLNFFIFVNVRHGITSLVGEQRAVDVVCMDCHKAFDSGSHTALTEVLIT